LAARVAFLAKLHKEESLEGWLTRIIKERVELEEVAFTEAKRELSLKGGA
jgi:RNA-binding protein YlmH